MATLTKSEIAALSVDERFALVDAIFESFGETETLEPPEWHRVIVEQRLADAEKRPELSVPWEEAKAGLEKKWLR